MTKTKKKGIVAGIAALSLACCVAGSVAVGGGIHLTARAADEFSAHTEGSTALVGHSKDAIVAALNKKVQELNAEIQAVLDEGKSLETAYAEGTIIAYSNRNDGIITQDNKRSGWKIWEDNGNDTALVLDLKYMNDGYNDWGEGSVSWLSYNGEDDKAYLITAEFARQYAGNGNRARWGLAKSDMFRVENGSGGYITYQNFTNAYMKSVNGNVTLVEKRNVNENGEEIAADPASTGYIGATQDSVLTKAGMDAGQFAQKFLDAYNKYKTAGFNVGYPISPVMPVGENYEGKQRYGTLCSQNFLGGDSVANPWNDDRGQWCTLAFNFEEKNVYLIANEFWYQFERVASGDVLQLGDPISDAFVANGNRYQNFEKGYMKAEGTTPQNAEATVVMGRNVNADTGLEETLDEAGKIGKLGNAVTENLPAGFTAAELSLAFKEAYEEKVEFASDEKLTSVDLVTYEDGLLLQTYTDSKGAKHKLVYSAEFNGFVYLRPAVASKISGLGAPLSERVLVAEKKTGSGEQTVYAYPFKNGYVSLNVSTQQKIQGGKPVITIVETSVAVLGSIYDSEKGFFNTTNFSDRLTAGAVSQDVLDKAYWNIWGVEKPTKEAIAAAFKKAYDDAFELGFSAGEPSSEGIVWWTTNSSGLIKITLKGGNGNGDFYGGDNTLMSYNPYDGKVYITTGAIATCYVNGASGNGWATTDMMLNTKTGVIVQQFDITDTDVTHRKIHIIVSNGSANKIDGEYDFEANKNGGEWVNYLTQFSASISQKPVTEPAHRNEGDRVEIDFASYLTNSDGYKVTWNKVSGKGTLSEDGKYTLDAMTAEDDEIVVEVYSAFDKITFKLTLTTEGESEPVNPGTPSTPGTTTPGEEESSGGCNSSITVSLALVGGMLAVGAAAGGIAYKKRKK